MSLFPCRSLNEPTAAIRTATAFADVTDLRGLPDRE
jgi:hypothetical protein